MLKERFMLRESAPEIYTGRDKWSFCLALAPAFDSDRASRLSA
jgi:hypothetical protein